jgi:hypothetical protein
LASIRLVQSIEALMTTVVTIGRPDGSTDRVQLLGWNNLADPKRKRGNLTYSIPPEAMADWSLTSLQLKLIKIGARVVRHARAITFQLAEVAVTGPMVRAILSAIRRLRAPPICA